MLFRSFLKSILEPGLSLFSTFLLVLMVRLCCYFGYFFYFFYEAGCVNSFRLVIMKQFTSIDSKLIILHCLKFVWKFKLAKEFSAFSYIFLNFHLYKACFLFQPHISEFVGNLPKFSVINELNFKNFKRPA